uniref:alpha-1,2-Mannosidase n=1 Tax=Caenorhabditis japonica TaxID=281687 RepID=A0A8R1HSJ9_CAEJA
MLLFNTRWKVFCLLVFVLCLHFQKCDGAELDVKALRKEAYEMFMHGYNSYMNYAFPADELMPLSCRGRIRGVTPSRGDVDDVLGNFSVTLLDSLDTLVVVNELDEFERAIDLVIKTVRFDSDLIVSVFETNIRVLGGLISAHVLAELVKTKHPERLQYYDKQLLNMAVEVGNRLLPAFNTTSGLPYSRINLKHGMLEHLKRQKDTCTACGGTMILEFAALTRLTGDPIYEVKARKAMDFLWQQRHRASDLMGTVLNVHSGDWVRRESGIGAGIDSYYEYTLKAYILLGDDRYLDRFNKHYEAIMRYVNKGPLFVDVHMHRPTVATRGFMDSLLAFWPGLQVLKGDVKEAIEMHEMLFQVIQKHKFLPEAFTHDFQVHWAEHPLRPEFVESTYFLYRATKDPHYLQVAKQIMDSINDYVKVPCGFASLKDIRTMIKEDQMESFVLSETFKYLYMIFTEPEDLIFDPDHFVLTTEAHFLPLSMGLQNNMDNPRKMILRSDEPKQSNYVCANPMDFTKLPTEREEAQLIRERTKMLLGEIRSAHLSGGGSASCDSPADRIRAWAFSANNQEHVKQLASMGIELVTKEDGRLHLSHQSANGKKVTCEIDDEPLCWDAWMRDDLARQIVTPSGVLHAYLYYFDYILVMFAYLCAFSVLIFCSSSRGSGIFPTIAMRIQRRQQNWQQNEHFD